MPSTKLKSDSAKTNNKLKQSRISFLACDKKEVLPTFVKSANDKPTTISSGSLE